MENLVSVQPHALDSHVPALCGPLQAESKDARASTSGAAGHADEAAAVLTCRYADTCSAVVVATAAGLVQTFVVAGEVSPTWAQQSPACITQGRHLVAIRSEVPVVSPHTDTFILRDVMHLQQTAPAAAPLQHAAAASLRLQLHADPSAPDRLYAVDAHGAHAVSLPWLPILANCLAPSSSDTGMLEDQLDLVPAIAEDLWHPIQQGQTIVSAAPLGSTLQPAGLLLMDSQSCPHCLRPSRLSSPHQDLEDSIGLADDRKAVAASSILFSNVLKGPEQITAPAPPDPPAPTGTGNHEGQKWLTDSVNHMRRKHVEFGHAAHHDIIHNIQELQRAAIQQQQQSEQLQERLAGLQDHQDYLDKHIKDASQVWLLPGIATQRPWDVH
ncbi:hypothetical protein ABBQ32_006499 [Trebouxia sp. C0010 RCD-2024]